MDVRGIDASRKPHCNIALAHALEHQFVGRGTQLHTVTNHESPITNHRRKLNPNARVCKGLPGALSTHAVVAVAKRRSVCDENFGVRRNLLPRRTTLGPAPASNHEVRAWCSQQASHTCEESVSSQECSLVSASRTGTNSLIKSHITTPSIWPGPISN